MMGTVEALVQDVRFTFRTLAKRPADALAVVLTLALGIGANTAIFSLAYPALLRPLPYQHPDQLVTLWETNPRQGVLQTTVSPANFADWRARNTAFDNLAALVPWKASLRTNDGWDRLVAVECSATLFPLLGVKPILGRALERHRQADNGVLISYAFWRSHFDSRGSAVGRQIVLDRFGYRRAYIIVGVLPLGFEFPFPLINEKPDVWTLLTGQEQYSDRRGHTFLVVGRLKPGVTSGMAASQMETIAQNLQRQYPMTNAGWGVAVVPLHDEVVRHVRPALIALAVAAVFVLLIACANVANLLLSRVSEREQEVAIRIVAGASKARIMRMFFTEGAVLSIGSAVIGFLVAFWCVPALKAFIPGSVFIRHLSETPVDFRAFIFALSLSAITALTSELGPALHLSGLNLNDVLKGSRQRNGGGRYAGRQPNLLVICEVAIALALLNGAGLMVRTLLKFSDAQFGFDPRDVLSMQVLLPNAEYTQPQRRIAFFGQLLDRVGHLAGVKAVGGADSFPLNEWPWKFRIEDAGRAEPSESYLAEMHAVTPGYFTTLGVPLLRGREFTEWDTSSSAQIVVISKSMSQRYWPRSNPIGMRITVQYHGSKAWTIVGVVGDVRTSTRRSSPRPIIYAPFLQAPQVRMSVLVRSRVGAGLLVSSVRKILQGLDGDALIANVSTAKGVISESEAAPRFLALLLTIFASCALALALTGIYGVMTCSSSRRIHEIGIRMALGARSGDVLWFMLRQGLIPVSAGLVVGSIISVVLARLLSAFLYGVRPIDPGVLIVACVALAATACVASYVPARRATRIDPVQALRNG
jgi:putative ABC transport system permease protein